MQSRLFFVKDIFKMAFPIMFGNLGFIMIGVGDVVVAGRHSTDTLAAISLATAITNCLMMFGIGILVSISAILSNYRGESKDTKTYFIPSVKFALILSFITMSMILACIPLIDKIGFEPRLVPLIKDYFFITAFAAYGGYLHCMAKEFLQAHEVVIFPNLLTIFCVFLNVFLNILFVFGYGKVPEMGAVGLAIASLITRYFMAFVLLLYIVKKFRVGNNNDKKYFKDLFKVGIPASFAIMIEFTAFNIISVVMGRVSGIYAAAHNILTTLTSVTFMIPLSFSVATSVKVGYSNGNKNFKNLKNYAWTGLGMCTFVMSFAAIIIALFPEFLISLFTKDTELMSVCIPVLVIVCCFQVFDGIQVALSGIFRGLKNTTVVMIVNLIAYWFISFPLGYYLGITCHMNLMGFWYGILVAAVFLCSMMMFFMIRKFSKLAPLTSEISTGL